MGTGKDDPMDKALDMSHQMNLGDIVILGSDGLWDNAFDEEII